MALTWQFGANTATVTSNISVDGVPVQTHSVALPGPGSDFFTGFGSDTYTGVFSDGAHVIQVSVSDGINPSVSATTTVTVQADTVPPTVTCPAVTPTFQLNSGPQPVTASVSDGQSGPLSPTVTADANTSQPGPGSVSLTGDDKVGNPTTVSCPYDVAYGFSGFLAPVDNPPTVNVGKAGRAYPVQFQLTDGNGSFVSSLSAVTSVTFTQINCATLSGDPTTTMTADATGATALRYDSTQSEYVFNWQTPKSAAETCQRLNLNLDSGQTFYADFDLS